MAPRSKQPPGPDAAFHSSAAGGSAPSQLQLEAIAAGLRALHGSSHWSSSGDPLDTLISTILSQHTSDINTARAFASLRSHYPRWDDVLSAPTADVAEAIRSGGLANIKAPRIQRVLEAIVDVFGEPTLEPLRAMAPREARRFLQALPGVGPKTAACVLLFSLGHPVMPVDTHVHRVSRRLGLISPDISAERAHAELDDLIGANRDEIYAWHMNLIAHGRTVCRARLPNCADCVLAPLCPSA